MALLSVDDLRRHITTPASNERLIELLDDAEQAIDEHIGPVGQARTMARPRGPLLMLPRRAAAIADVREGGRVVDAALYELRHGGRMLARLRGSWSGEVDVRFLPIDDVAQRIRVQIQLVQLDLTYQPGMVQQTIGAWAEMYGQGDRTFGAEREAILATLSDGAGFIR